MRKTAIASALTLILSSPLAFADRPSTSDWIDSGIKNKDDNIVYLDQKNVERNGDIVSIWIGAFEKGFRTRIVENIMINCSSAQYLQVEIYKLNAKGDQIGYRKYPSNKQWLPLMPGSVGFSLKEQICPSGIETPAPEVPEVAPSPAPEKEEPAPAPSIKPSPDQKDI